MVFGHLPACRSEVTREIYRASFSEATIPYASLDDRVASCHLVTLFCHGLSSRPWKTETARTRKRASAVDKLPGSRQPSTFALPSHPFLRTMELPRAYHSRDTEPIVSKSLTSLSSCGSEGSNHGMKGARQSTTLIQPLKALILTWLWRSPPAVQKDSLSLVQ